MPEYLPEGYCLALTIPVSGRNRHSYPALTIPTRKANPHIGPHSVMQSSRRFSYQVVRTY